MIPNPILSPPYKKRKEMHVELEVEQQEILFLNSESRVFGMVRGIFLFLPYRNSQSKKTNNVIERKRCV